MSASSKKKLRREQEAAKLTERQLTEQKEAKKLNLYTTLFVTVLSLLLVVALVVGIFTTVQNTGVRERKTIAVTVGNHEVSNAELGYFYVDAINTFMSQYGSYASMFGLDTTKPLNEQYLDEENGLTWADDFLNSAKSTAKTVYALNDAAEAAGYSLPQDKLDEIELTVSNINAYAVLYGYPDADTYMKAMYGKGANLESYKDYCVKKVIADAYYSAYGKSLSFSEDELRAADAENPINYNAYSFNYYYLASSRYLEGGTVGEDGTTVTYSDEEKAASVTACEEAAKALCDGTITSVEQFNKEINRLSINAETEIEASSVACDDYLYGSIITLLADWVADEARQEGEMTYIPSTSTSTDADGNEVTTVTGYYVVYFKSSTDNTYPLTNVRHILVPFKGGQTDSNTGITTYSEEEKQAAWTEAEDLYEQWKSGEATEESFATMATEFSTDTGSIEKGGLYEDIYPGQMVSEFEDWCFADRKTGDTGLVETTYGVHILYYVSDSETNYRDYMIHRDLMNNATTEWYDALVAAMTETEGDCKFIPMDLVISNG